MYDFMSMCKWSGVDPKANLEEGSLAVLCPSCPQPEINMAPDWEKTPEEDA